jgi:hypothetical protein
LVRSTFLDSFNLFGARQQQQGNRDRNNPVNTTHVAAWRLPAPSNAVTGPTKFYRLQAN